MTKKAFGELGGRVEFSDRRDEAVNRSNPTLGELLAQRSGDLDPGQLGLGGRVVLVEDDHVRIVLFDRFDEAPRMWLATRLTVFGSGA